MSTWYDSEMDVLQRQDHAHATSRTSPLRLPEDENERPSLLRRIWERLVRDLSEETAEERRRQVMLRAGR